MKPKNDTWALLLFNYESLIAEENLIRFLPAGDGGGDPTDLFINSDAEEKRHRKAHEETSGQDDCFLRLCLWEGTGPGRPRASKSHVSSGLLALRSKGGHPFP